MNNREIRANTELKSNNPTKIEPEKKDSFIYSIAQILFD